MPLDSENLSQYNTPFHCPECGGQTFQTDREVDSVDALVEAECTNCGHALTAEEVHAQAASLPVALTEEMITRYRGRP